MGVSVVENERGEDDEGLVDGDRESDAVVHSVGLCEDVPEAKFETVLNVVALAL